MKKKIFFRILSGFFIGLSIGYLITIILSLIWGKGYYSPCVPELIGITGSEIKAVLLQAFLCGILGYGFGACSIIWEIEKWGIVKQTGIYFLITSVIMMPIAYITYWMEHSIKGMISYFGMFALIFAAIWVVQYIKAKHNVKRMNKVLSERRQKENE